MTKHISDNNLPKELPIYYILYCNLLFKKKLRYQISSFKKRVDCLQWATTIDIYINYLTSYITAQRQSKRKHVIVTS